MIYVMQTAIITDNINKAQFIQKALKYENIYSNIFDSKVHQFLNISLYGTDGVFIYIRDFFIIRKIAEGIRSSKRDIVIFCLQDEYNQDLEKLAEEKNIDLYFVRPFPFRRIASEMKYMIFNLKENKEEELYEFRDLKIDVSRREVRVKEVPVYLRNKEFALLQHFIMNSGRVLTRNSILENVWDRNTNIFTNTVDVHVSQLRKKIRKITGEEYIYTIPCTGYVMK
jgi:DNA-binding response OmpR family regulator